MSKTQSFLKQMLNSFLSNENSNIYIYIYIYIYIKKTIHFKNDKMIIDSSLQKNRKNLFPGNFLGKERYN